MNFNRIEYAENIKNITSILSGMGGKILQELKSEMQKAVKNQKFEKAAKIRDQISGLENIFSHRYSLENIRSRTSNKAGWRKVERDIRTILGVKWQISRVEGYDISNISGTEATGSMVVFVDGAPAKSEYRKFKIKTIYQPNDVDMLKEIIKRRMRHSEWPYPDLMLIDGGKPQLNAAKAALKLQKRRFFITALAKREEELYTESRKQPIRLSTLPQETAFFFQRVRDESHRFAKKYHHKLRELKLKNG